MSEESIKNITKSNSNLAPTFEDGHVLPDMSFDGHCLRKNNISTPKRSSIKKFKHRLCIK